MWIFCLNMQRNLHSECCCKQLFFNEERKYQFLDMATSQQSKNYHHKNSIIPGRGEHGRGERNRDWRRGKRKVGRTIIRSLVRRTFARGNRVLGLFPWQVRGERGMLYILQLSLLCLPQFSSLLKLSLYLLTCMPVTTMSRRKRIRWKSNHQLTPYIAPV